MKNNSSSIRYPASPQSNAFCKNNSVVEAERRAYLIRLRNYSFRDYEISKCQTCTDLERVSHDIIESEALEKISKSYWNDDCLNDDIPVVYDEVGLITYEDLRKAGHINKDGMFSDALKNELQTQSIYDSHRNLVSQEQLESQLEDLKQQHNFDDDTFDESSTKLIFNTIIPSGVWDDIRYEGYSLPGVAEPYETCQKHGLLACTNSSQHNHGKDVVKSFRYSCKRGTCKKCAEAWANREAMRIRSRILAYRENIQQMSNHTRNPKSSHCVLSFPEKSNFGIFSEKKKKRVIRKILKDIGSLGGCEIYHPFRFAKQSDFAPRISPHYHYIIYGWFNEQKIKNAYEKYGVIFKKIDTLHNPFDIFNVAKYILSHSAQKKNRHSIKWIGELGYRKLKVDPILDSENICEYCGEKFIPVKVVDFDLFKGIPPPEFEEAVLMEHGAVSQVDFLNGEKVPYYDLDWRVFYKKTKSEIDAEIHLEEAIMWNKTAAHSQRITKWI